ncbi:hypothetical protein [Secundilactobacillus paracollinoides]|nr:hypothetical protein [Secundilactobacillus paracollinoides]ANZ61833.1 hypothetical protein AYR61_11070 [Secundilactobacillus paracollinoides]
MSHRNHLWVAGLAVIAISLAGCQQSTKSQATSSGSQSSQASQSSTKKAESAASASSSNNTVATMKNYQVPASEKQKKSYVKSGLLTIPGEFSYDKAGTKLTLKKKQNSTRKTASTGLSYQMISTKMITNSAKTSAAKQMAEQAFNVTTIANPYQTIQINFKINNQLDQDVRTDGINKVVFNGTNTATSASGLSDSSAGQTIKAHQTRTFHAMVLTGTADTTVTKLAIQFSGSFSANGEKRSSSPKTLDVALN